MEQNKTPTEETEVKQPEAEAVEETAAETETVSEASDAIADLQAKLDALNDKHLRMAAEYDNFRKRSQREREAIHAEAVAYTVKALLPTYDNLERALKAETADAEYKKGVELTMTQLVESLKGIGVEKIAAEPGTAFDPNLMNAVMHIENEELGENVIAEVFQQGFQIGDKVIRHAMVQVAN
ncbi:MAG: nucleotide exchange factor GrpE [Butyricicoccus pullicaecorum]|nr:nucleotide exchange factor GrpE [Butyricicoccus pullicaecorum]